MKGGSQAVKWQGDGHWGIARAVGTKAMPCSQDPEDVLGEGTAEERPVQGAGEERRTQSRSRAGPGQSLFSIQQKQAEDGAGRGP